ncbi:MAG: response regulator [Thermodesulfovibrionales bacterium]|nr:response regulator [Thermodesulfovibrionales bacterium]
MTFKILIAEQDQLLLETITEILTKEGFEVKSIATASDALNEIDIYDPHLALISSDFPDTDSYELCKKIKTLKTNKEIPIILLAGAYEPFNEEYAWIIGIDDHILKPFEASELLSKIKRFLDKVKNSLTIVYTHDYKTTDTYSLITQDRADDVEIIYNSEEIQINSKRSYEVEKRNKEDYQIVTSSETINHEKLNEVLPHEELTFMLKKHFSGELDNYIKIIFDEKFSTLCKDKITSKIYELAPKILDEIIDEKIRVVLTTVTQEIEEELKKVLPDIIRTIINKKLEKVV